MSAGRELWVMFDTSAIKSDEKHVFSAEAQRLIRNHTAGGHDLGLRWHVPQMVVDERIFQMTKTALEHYRGLRRLESAIGRSFDFSEPQLRDTMRARVLEQLGSLGVESVPLAVAAVRWDRVMSDAVNRAPPFEADTEKGFRDACILETFAQLHATAPSLSENCRVALVSGDKLLRKAADQRFLDVENARVLSDVAALGDLINVLVSNAGETIVNEVRDAARRAFFDNDAKRGLFFDNKLRDQIREKCGAETVSPPDAEGPSKWIVKQPKFERKDRMRMYWTTRVECRSTVLRENAEKPAAGPEKFESDIVKAMLSGAAGDANYIFRSVPTLRQRAWCYTAHADVLWNVRVTEAKSLEDARIDDIICRGHTIELKPAILRNVLMSPSG